MLRGEVWWTALPKPVASEPGFRRSIVLVQSDIFTRSRIRTVLAVVITSNQRLVRASLLFASSCAMPGAQNRRPPKCTPAALMLAPRAGLEPAT